MSEADRRRTFIAWITTYAWDALRNEDDVETKFVLPLFERLGYPETHRRGKYPVHEQSGSRGRKKEIDQIFFSTDITEEQAENVALVIVEAKHPDKTDLTEATLQAQSYGNSLKPLLLVITNGRHILALKRHRFLADERIFDDAVETLNEPARAEEFYDLLNFEMVRQLKLRLTDDLNHEQLMQLERSLQTYPEIQAILSKEDFEPGASRNGRVLTVVRRKVALEGILPLSFNGGSCAITFSHILRRGLRIHLSHRDILNAFMVGLETPPDWQTRRFIEPEEGLFRVRLGQTTTLLSAQEALDLCACVDHFAKAYRAVIFETEDHLKTWRSSLISTINGPGAYLLSVRPQVWKAMRRFGEEFEWGNGDSAWHIFEHYAPALRISHPKQDHALIYGFSQLPDHVSFLGGYVHLVYVMPDAILKLAEDKSGSHWPQSVGPHGLWTAEFTQRWIEQEFVPKLRSHFHGSHLRQLWKHDAVARMISLFRSISRWRHLKMPTRWQFSSRISLSG